MNLFIVLDALPVLGAVAVLVLAQTQVRERAEKAALMMSVGAGLEVAFAAARQFSDLELLWIASGAVHTGSVALVVYGLVLLADELNPKLAGSLPPLLGNLKAEPNVIGRVVLGAVGCLWIVGTSLARERPQYAVVAALAIGFVLWGSSWIERQGPLAKFVLERRPDLVVWAYVYQLRVINRQTGHTSVSWSARVALATGALVNLPADGEHHAQSLVATIAQRCPGIALGFTAELQSRFKSNPQSLRAGAAAPSFGAVG